MDNISVHITELQKLIKVENSLPAERNVNPVTKRASHGEHIGKNSPWEIQTSKYHSLLTFENIIS